ncbi:MAG: helix-turn-helix domain-containing protein [Propionibacteriaceae bacterium]|nr:helix-turn-helix domain-containing protein [Propionibacteriaceae bacterium]
MPEFMNSRSLTKLGNNVCGLRQRRGLTQASLAEKAGVSRQWIISLERAKTRGLELGALLRVLDALDVSLYLRDDLEGLAG